MAAPARYARGSKAPAAGAGVGAEAHGDAHRGEAALEAKAIGEALDLFPTVMAMRLPNAAARKKGKERLLTLPRLEKASRHLARATKVLFRGAGAGRGAGADLDVAALWRRCRRSPRAPPR